MPKKRVKILVIEDELALNKMITDYLTQLHYTCESVTNYPDAREKIDCFQYDCIVLDIMLPGGNGLQLLQQLKENKQTDGVIILSARNELDDKITGLQAGADDYLTKPFHLSELNVRIAAIIRRKSLHGSAVLHFEEIKADTVARTISVFDKNLVLTRKEYDLLVYLILNKNRILSKTTIAEHLWGDEMGMADNHDFIYTHIKNLRRKLMQAGGGEYIHSVYGMGYKFSVR